MTDIKLYFAIVANTIIGFAFGSIWDYTLYTLFKIYTPVFGIIFGYLNGHFTFQKVHEVKPRLSRMTFRAKLMSKDRVILDNGDGTYAVLVLQSENPKIYEVLADPVKLETAKEMVNRDSQ